jgi:hypothetical protein
VAIDASPATTERAPPHQLGGEGAQVGAAQKKRAKRVERSARSKS